MPTQSFMQIEKAISSLQGREHTRIAKTTLNNKDLLKASASQISTGDTATVIQTARYWHKNRRADQQNQTEDLDINPHTYQHPMLLVKMYGVERRKQKYLYVVPCTNCTPNRTRIYSYGESAGVG